MLNLEKGAKLDLKKEDGTPVTEMRFGGGWDAVEEGADIDGDLFAFDEAGNVTYFNDKTGIAGTELDEDNLTGEDKPGEEGTADENIAFNTALMTSKKVVIAINIYKAAERNQDFSKVKELFVEIEDTTNKKMIGEHKISGNESATGKDVLVVGTIEKTDAGLTFTGIYEYDNGDIEAIAAKYKPTV